MSQELGPSLNPHYKNREWGDFLQIPFSEQTWARQTLTLAVSRAYKPRINNLWLCVAAMFIVEALAVAGAIYYVDQRISNPPIIIIDSKQGYI